MLTVKYQNWRKGFVYRPKFSKKNYGNVNGFLGKFFVFSVKSSVNKQTILEDLRQTRQMQVPLDIAFAEIILTGLLEMTTKLFVPGWNYLG